MIVEVPSSTSAEPANPAAQVRADEAPLGRLRAAGRDRPGCVSRGDRHGQGGTPRPVPIVTTPVPRPRRRAARGSSRLRSGPSHAPGDPGGDARAHREGLPHRPVQGIAPARADIPRYGGRSDAASDPDETGDRDDLAAEIAATRPRPWCARAPSAQDPRRAAPVAISSDRVNGPLLDVRFRSTTWPEAPHGLRKALPGRPAGGGAARNRHRCRLRSRCAGDLRGLRADPPRVEMRRWSGTATTRVRRSWRPRSGPRRRSRANCTRCRHPSSSPGRRCGTTLRSVPIRPRSPSPSRGSRTPLTSRRPRRGGSRLGASRSRSGGTAHVEADVRHDGPGHEDRGPVRRLRDRRSCPGSASSTRSGSRPRPGSTWRR